MGKRHPSQAVLSVWKRDGSMVSLYFFSADAICKTVGQHFDLHVAVLICIIGTPWFVLSLISWLMGISCH